jgi:hypothetical protein
MLFQKDKIDLSESTLPMDGSKKLREEYRKRILGLKDDFKSEQSKRRKILRKRFDFYVGSHEDYTTIPGNNSKGKKGHASAVFNYAGRGAKKIAFSLTNNPPTMTFGARKIIPKTMFEEEFARAQSIEDFVSEVFKENLFWYKAYRRGVFNQVVMGDAAIKVYPINKGTAENPDWSIKICNHEKIDNLMVGWRGDDNFAFDFVIAEEKRTIKSVEDEFKIKVPEKLLVTPEKDTVNFTKDKTNWAESKLWEKGEKGAVELPEEPDLPSVILTEYDDLNYYCIMIAGQIVEFVIKDDVTYPKIQFFTLVPNIPIPRNQWSGSDIDDLVEPQIEFNEASNDERDYIRVGAAQKFLAYNMSDFNPESIKTGSGGVIFIDSPDNSARFEPLQTNVNVFPIDQYLNRVQGVIFDMGVPKVSYGSGGADSGRSKAIDYQSMVELLDYKRDSWEMALSDISEKIQRIGNFYFGKDISFFKDPLTNEFVVRYPDFNWAEIVPITQADKVVNVLNKVQMGLPFRLAFQELGYTDVDGVINEMKRESKDPELMEFRSKMYQLTGGIMEATKRAQALQQDMGMAPPTPNVNEPTLTTPGGSPQPVSQAGTTSFSSPRGFINRTRQNLTARGRA